VIILGEVRVFFVSEEDVGANDGNWVSEVVFDTSSFSFWFSTGM
jgi:hypothetical protein